MAKWKVEFVQTVYEGTDVWVEADTQEAAESLAFKRVYGEIGDAPEWEFIDAAGSPEIVSAFICKD